MDPGFDWSLEGFAPTEFIKIGQIGVNTTQSENSFAEGTASQKNEGGSKSERETPRSNFICCSTHMTISIIGNVKDCQIF